MNITHLSHSAAAIVIQLLLWPFVGLFTGGLVAIAFLLGREYSQVERKVTKRTGIPTAKMMPWYVLKPNLWSVDAILDVAAPAAACTALWLGINLWVK